MSRALIVLSLSLLLALVSSASAANKKKVVKAEPSPSCYPISRAKRPPKNYKVVDIHLHVPVPEDKDPMDVARKATFIFGLHFPVASLKQVPTYWLMGAMTCREDTLLPEGFFRAGPVWFRMRTEVGTVRNQTYVLNAQLWLPARVIAREPRAETRLNIDVGYRGEWKFNAKKIELELKPRPPDD